LYVCNIVQILAALFLPAYELR